MFNMVQKEATVVELRRLTTDFSNNGLAKCFPISLTEAEICEIAAVMGMHRTLPSLSTSSAPVKGGHVFAAAGSRVTALANTAAQTARAFSLSQGGQVSLPSLPLKLARPKTAAATVNQVSVDSVNTIMSYWYKCYTFCDC
jgi:hypothetical protein